MQLEYTDCMQNATKCFAVEVQLISSQSSLYHNFLSTQNKFGQLANTLPLKFIYGAKDAVQSCLKTGSSRVSATPSRGAALIANFQNAWQIFGI